MFAELVRLGQRDEIGGPQFLAELFDRAGSGADLFYHAEQVRNAAAVRRLHRLAVEMTGLTRTSGQPAADLLADFEQKLFDIGATAASRGDGIVSADEAIAEAKGRIDERQLAGKPRGVATGYADLDEFLGGLRPGTLTIVAARPSVGKTALTAGLLLNAAAAGTSGLLVSLEMSREEIAERFLAMVSNVSLSRISGTDKLNPSELGKVCSVKVGWNGGRVWIDDRPGQTAARIASTTRRAVRRHNVGPIVIDYLQLVHAENARDPRHLQVGMVATRLKELARTARVPVVALAQLNREIENRTDGKPKLSDLRDSGQIEQDADSVILLHPQPADPKALVQDVDALLEKNRNGPRGVVPLLYRRANVRFEPRSVECR
ncbi:replicative DNA helicase [Limnoglobus roseus]|uniref:Replicative DNA helicase n=1 Tax=Limnoglobus roseus TaxID=2598579 RepID=A0A5C1AN44_9BACT|nr:replicative DNA helicase [Limnoglobus roseus]